MGSGNRQEVSTHGPSSALSADHTGDEGYAEQVLGPHQRRVPRRLRLDPGEGLLRAADGCC